MDQFQEIPLLESLLNLRKMHLPHTFKMLPLDLANIWQTM